MVVAGVLASPLDWSEVSANVAASLGVAAATLGAIVQVRGRARDRERARTIVTDARRRLMIGLWAEQVASGQMSPEEYAQRVSYLETGETGVLRWSDVAPVQRLPGDAADVDVDVDDGGDGGGGPTRPAQPSGVPPDDVSTPKGPSGLERYVNLISAVIGVAGLIVNALLGAALREDPKPDCVGYVAALGAIRGQAQPLDVERAFGPDGLSFGDLETSCGPPESLFP